MNGIVQGYLPESTARLVSDVAAGHWPALEAVVALQENGRWQKLLEWLRDNGLTGESLCAALSEFDGDAWALADWARGHMVQADPKPLEALPEGMTPARVFHTR